MPTVRREARESLRDGRPRLLRLCPPEQLGRAPQEGVVEVALTCVSGGTLEIYLEPQLTQPHLVIVGHQAAPEALAVSILSEIIQFRWRLPATEPEFDTEPEAYLMKG